MPVEGFVGEFNIVAVIEGSRYGGTCVNVGCVPKKVMFNASHVMETIKSAKEFGIHVGDVQFNWNALKHYRDRYIQRLNGIYESGLDKVHIDRIAGFASFVDDNTLRVGEQLIRAKHILLAPGGTPEPVTYPGAEYVIDSNGFFELENQPKKVAVIGAGYIAVELAGVLNGLGSETLLFCRHDRVLRSFDTMLSTQLMKEMSKHGPTVVPHSFMKEVTKAADGTYTIHLENGNVSIRFYSLHFLFILYNYLLFFPH